MGEDGFTGDVAIEMASLDISTALIGLDAIEQFVTRMYQQALGKEPSQANLVDWTAALKNGSPAASVAYEFIFSREFLLRNVSNNSYVDILYRALLGREPDSQGRTAWRNRIAAGWPRENVMAGFINSVEFTNLCSQAGIVRGTYTPPPGIAEHTRFVTNMYRGVLGREPEQDGLQIWIKRIREGRTGASVAQGFVFSSEAQRSNISNEQYIDSLYRGLMGREPDSQGRATWLKRLKAGWPRENVFAGFINSAEFTKLCSQTGVIRGTYTPPPGLMEHVFITRLYRGALEREPDQAGLKAWVNRMLTGKTASSVAYGFIFSDEMNKRNLSDEQFVDALYRSMLGREPDSQGRATWIRRLQNGYSRYDAFVGFVNSSEFSQVCRDLGITKGTAP